MSSSGAREIERLTVYLPHAVSREIRLAAERAGQSLSVWVKRAAEQALAQEKGQSR
jgi:predicted HicB family RNase H-like nuclease